MTLFLRAPATTHFSPVPRRPVLEAGSRERWTGLSRPAPEINAMNQIVPQPLRKPKVAGAVAQLLLPCVQETHIQCLRTQQPHEDFYLQMQSYLELIDQDVPKRGGKVVGRASLLQVCLPHCQAPPLQMRLRMENRANIFIHFRIQVCALIIKFWFFIPYYWVAQQKCMGLPKRSRVGFNRVYPAKMALQNWVPEPLLGFPPCTRHGTCQGWPVLGEQISLQATMVLPRWLIWRILKCTTGFG